jgi:hypothetical protein
MQVVAVQVKLMAGLLVQVEQVVEVQEQLILVSQLMAQPILAVVVVVDTLEMFIHLQVQLLLQQVVQG